MSGVDVPVANLYVEIILAFLYNHIGNCKRVSLAAKINSLILDFVAVDLHARIKWQPGTVALWDERITAHVSIFLDHFPRNLNAYIPID